ncbi:UNVERIFIED_ORG: hypothetical protein FNL38_109123 [Nocardia globerula]|uniref:site-specific DNA-methyltransferase (adenine-specific) n=1 Tax=Nocardia globerula TaxID=1818 RepID=A0A652YIP8_NOCGL|nr:DNA methyltransferase [Rhodococcus globerulus]NMD64000.1 class I SAM-dependent DNA methyltransferase [Nocardia globerula]PVX66738.1 hypothetical protein C8E04_4079 [Rhodococcus globerulus]
MATFDSIVVGEDWISEHYFTTDSVKESFQGKVLELRKHWDAEAKEGLNTVRQAFLAACRDLHTRIAALAEDPGAAPVAHALIRESLGFAGTLAPFHGERAGTDVDVPDAALAGVDQVLFLQARPVESINDLLDPTTGQLIDPAIVENKQIHAVSKAVSEVFHTDEPPAFVVVQAGQWLLLAEAERWAEGRYLAVDLLVVAERRHEARGGEIDRALAIFGRQSLVSDADGNIWWTGVLEDSVKHTVGVSKDLREGIRLSIELIANEVVNRRAAKKLTLDGINGQELAKHSLRFLYRILFLLYAEASPEMRVLPTGAPEYGEGYGLDRLRELTLTELVSPHAQSGTHLYESLATLFRLVDRGHTPHAPEHVTDDPAPGLEFNSLRADLFSPKATALIDEVGLGNETAQKVLEHLLLSKESKGRKGTDRGFISYAELGINQLGAVYEGLMSYTGFFAGEDLYEVAKNGDSEKGSWVVPVTRADHLSKSDFVLTSEPGEEPIPVVHKEGSFVFRLAGRERQQSASYYTPEVLTKFVVSQALEELLDQDGTRTTPEQILQFTICEPALGSGAFAIEAVRQLAAEYLKRKQEDLGKRIDADKVPFELQKVKAHIALHQVYGVDLNATAVELAEISLWLDTMVAGLQAPWFGLHLRCGNSLIGARRAVYSPSLFTKKSWLTTVPKDVPLNEEIGAGIHHFLVPSQGWGAVVDTAEAKTYAANKREDLRLWRNGIRGNPSKTIVKRLSALAQRVETLWDFTARRLEIAESEIHRNINIWGTEKLEYTPAIAREHIELSLNDANGAYRRLRRIMDSWSALWSWPLTTNINAPDWDQWTAGLEAILGIPRKEKPPTTKGQLNMFADLDWFELDAAESNDILFSGAKKIEDAVVEFPWLVLTESISVAQGFFHWELDFAPVFAAGGFDLQVGNPPWVRPGWDEVSAFAEFDPWWTLTADITPEGRKEHIEYINNDVSAIRKILDQRSLQAGAAESIGSSINHPILRGLHPNLYRSFMEHSWRSRRTNGVVALLHPDNHFIEPNAAALREKCYLTLRRHWEFRNQIKLFEEIGNTRPYSVNIYGNQFSKPNFLHAAHIYHPDTIERSLVHDRSGTPPGMKDVDGNWSRIPHADRIITVTEAVLRTWSDLVDPPGTPSLAARMVYTCNNSANSALDKIAKAPRMNRENFDFTQGWTEGKNLGLGFYVKRPAYPESWTESIYQGPQISVANPLFQQTKIEAKSHRDYEKIDLEKIDQDFIPRSRYQVSKPQREYLDAYPKWEAKSSSDFYRLIWRRRLDDAMERTVLAAIAPPGLCHVHQVMTGRLPSNRETVIAAGIWASLPVDFLVRAAGFSDLLIGTIATIPFIDDSPLEHHLIHRIMRLNCLVQEYSDLWEELFSPEWMEHSWVSGISGCPHDRTPLGDISQDWTRSTPVRRDIDRRQALIEIDAIVAVMLKIDSEEFIALYRAQFPVLITNENAAVYDSEGRLLPAKVVGELHKERKLTPFKIELDGQVYRGPFMKVDREKDMILAHEHFRKLLP